jgi:sulfoxide reductase catalytic subunit YedY
LKPDLGKTPSASEITPEAYYQRRREFIKNTLLFAATATGVGTGLVGLMGGGRRSAPSGSPPPADWTGASKSRYSTAETQTSYLDVTTYNNFYEFGTEKGDPARNAHTLRPRPWTVAIEGEVRRPQVVDIDRLIQWFPLEERVYRMRCVEAWSMVIPWRGVPLRDVLARYEPGANAKYVAFRTLLDPTQMPGQKRAVLDWPYREGLRMDEAVHPLVLLATGMYGRDLPNQNGAPLRLVVPWKYGFKSIKSIVRIRFVEKMPATSWALSAPREYGFFANVNPEVDHPRWSQKSERRIGTKNLFERLPTRKFNGYEREVAGLYRGMNLARYF